MSGVEVVRAECLSGFAHGFLGRLGGVSTGVLAGLNVGYGSEDDLGAVEENRRRATEAIAPGAQLATVHQIHSAEAVYVEQPWVRADRPHADAMVTDRPGVLLGILTADCAPVLFADREAGVIGAAHAGWRGALAGVTESTIAAMEHLGARRARICAAVGPCIAQPSYEVDEAFRDRFAEADAANTRFFEQQPGGQPYFDLSGYVSHRLQSAGIATVEQLRLDTYSENERFYSYRRATHRHEANYGRQLSAIAL